MHETSGGITKDPEQSAIKTQHPEYGLASLDAVVALVPKDRRVTVGLVTVPFQYECDSCNAF